MLFNWRLLSKSYLDSTTFVILMNFLVRSQIIFEMIYELPPILKHPPSIKRPGSFDDTQPQKPDIQTFVETKLRKRKITLQTTISQKSILKAKKSPKFYANLKSHFKFT